LDGFARHIPKGKLFSLSYRTRRVRDVWLLRAHDPPGAPHIAGFAICGSRQRHQGPNPPDRLRKSSRSSAKKGHGVNRVPLSIAGSSCAEFRRKDRFACSNSWNLCPDPHGHGSFRPSFSN